MISDERKQRIARVPWEILLLAGVGLGLGLGAAGSSLLANDPDPVTGLRANHQTPVSDAVLDTDAGTFHVRVAGGTCTVDGTEIRTSGEVFLDPVEPTADGLFLIWAWNESVVGPTVNDQPTDATPCEFQEFDDDASLDDVDLSFIGDPELEARIVAGRRAAVEQMLVWAAAGEAQSWRIVGNTTDVDLDQVVPFSSDPFPVLVDPDDVP